ncbi:DUF6585 family protein [Streptomyces morookaense]|uniref:Uncharacterized protein n=1 Tax=Streptomyces morookaense TaxID=1970 RepID=A0A7Y7BAL8_STRMO|nr:DUF6585 family protein [Streptomyces morookaense]NVK81879.1 hypothetical protein [Streptomyces morookaense]GHF54983.1 hypothetical protein GCM10010359_66550 [Streptomyces morookaense]
MTGGTPPQRGEELLLARISAAAGRAHLGRRCATYTAHAHAAPVGGIRGLLAHVRNGLPPVRRPRPDARLDLYERGMTVIVKGRIRIIRYDTTSVFRQDRTFALTLTDADGERIALSRGEADEWIPEIQRAVTGAQLPPALARLDAGERLAFGDIWLTGEEVGTGVVSARWSQVQRIEIRDDVVIIGVTGMRNGPEAAASATPNLFVLRALVEYLRTESGHP